MFKTIKKFFNKEKTLEDKVKEKYKLSEYDLHRQRAMFDYRNNDNKYKTNNEFLYYILVFGLLSDYSKDTSLGGSNNYSPYNNDYSYHSSSNSSSSSYDNCSCSSSSSSD